MTVVGLIETCSAQKLPGAPDGVAAFVAELEAAFTLGSRRTTPKFAETGDDSKDYMRVFRLDDMSLRERQIFGSAKIHCNRARTYAARGDALAAWGELGVAQHILQFFAPGTLHARLGRTERLAAEAAVHYQGNDFFASRASLEEVRENDRALVEEFQMAGTRAHGFHLIGKQAQLETAERRYALALAVSATGIRLLSGQAALEPARMWPSSPEEAAPLPFLLRRMLSRQLVIEVGATLLHAPPAEMDRALGDFRAALGECLELDALTAMDRDFLAAILSGGESGSEFGGDQDHRVAKWVSWAAFLEHARGSAETLWLLGALQAARSCAGVAQAENFRRTVFADLAAHSAFPERVRDTWRRLARS